MDYVPVTKYVLIGLAAICLAFSLWSYAKERKSSEQTTTTKRVAALEIFYHLLIIAVLIGRFDIYFTII